MTIYIAIIGRWSYLIKLNVTVKETNVNITIIVIRGMYFEILTLWISYHFIIAQLY